MLASRLLIIALLANMASAMWTPCRLNAQGADGPTPARVENAIRKCVAYLYREQRANGTWSGHENYGAGTTAMITLALLNAGEKPSDPRIQKSLRLLRRTTPTQTYEIAVHCMVFCLAEPGKDMGIIENDVKLLIDIQNPDGGWGYDLSRTSPDESNSQFAVLALWEASKLGIAIPDDCIEKGLLYWRTRHLGNGWGYGSARGVSGSMTCAGIASMLILRDAADGVDARVVGDQLQCCGNQTRGVDPVELGMQWLARSFSISSNPGGEGAWAMYYLYALERVGRLTGQRFIGDVDWYRAGAEHLLKIQDESGKMRGSHTEIEHIASAMALLFLAKGKRQVVIGHLEHGNGNDWQLHRRSVQNLTGQIEKVWKRELAWQSIKIEKANLQTLAETPVLFISGSKAFQLTEPQRKLLKSYVEQGNVIFAEACNGDGCDGEAFDKSFRAEMEKIFDRPLTKLPPTHAVWNAEATIDPTAMPEGFWLYGLDACCKTSVIYSPISLSCRWELARPWGSSKSIAGRVKKDIDNAVKIGVNVVAYATGRELKEKLDALEIVEVPTNIQSLNRGTLKIAKILHSGGADDASRAVVTMLSVYREKTRSLVDLETPLISLADKELEKFPLLYIHGRSSFVLSEAERTGLRRHFETGGFVLGDSVCAASEFSKSVRDEFKKAMPDAKWVVLDVSHPFMTKNDPDAFEGFDITNVTIVDPSGGANDLKRAKRQGIPEIEGLEWNGRIVALFSPNDLSCAMESKHSMQCKGYV
ncbi:MAG: DUF4159 domain-containing protein, partial [Pirellula sp.]